MTCDGTNSDQLVAGDVWVWPYSTSDDISGFSDPVIELRDTNGNLLASNVTSGDDVASVNTTSIGEFPGTDFDAGDFVWWVDSAERDLWPSSIELEVDVLDQGVSLTIWPASTYRVRADVARRVAS